MVYVDLLSQADCILLSSMPCSMCTSQRLCMCQNTCSSVQCTLSRHPYIHVHAHKRLPRPVCLTGLLSLLLAPGCRDFCNIISGATRPPYPGLLYLKACSPFLPKSRISTLKTLTLGNFSIILLQLHIQREGRALEHLQYLWAHDHNFLSLCWGQNRDLVFVTAEPKGSSPFSPCWRVY